MLDLGINCHIQLWQFAGVKINKLTTCSNDQAEAVDSEFPQHAYFVDCMWLENIFGVRLVIINVNRR